MRLLSRSLHSLVWSSVWSSCVFCNIQRKFFPSFRLALVFVFEAALAHDAKEGRGLRPLKDAERVIQGFLFKNMVEICRDWEFLLPTQVPKSTSGDLLCSYFDQYFSLRLHCVLQVIFQICGDSENNNAETAAGRTRC